MDIPKHSVNSSSISQASRPSLTLSTVDDLKLETGKTYSGTVVAPKQPQTTNKEWLVQIKGQAVIVSSDTPLEKGQKLLLKLDPASTPEKPSLIAQLLPTKSSIESKQGTQNNALLNISTASNLNSKSPLSANNIASSNDLIKPLLQAINATLDKQVPLQQGFNQLSALFSTPSTTLNSQGLSPEHMAAMKQLIMDKLPKLNNIVQLNQTAATTQMSGNYLKQSLMDSGLFLEHNLSSKPEQLASLKALLNSVNLPHINTPSTQLAPSVLSARDKIQQTIESLLQLAQTKNNKSTHEQTGPLNDLKASLLSASSILMKQLASKLSESELNALFLSQQTDTPQPSPFAFPMLPHTATPKKLFESQELSTGQLLKLLAGMIHKLQFNQLNSLMQASNNGDSALQQSWFFELPLLTPQQTVQTFNFRLDKEQQESNSESDLEDGELRWKLLLSFDLASLGPIYVQVTLSNHTISPILWANQQNTLELLEKESAYFEAQLKKIGLNVNSILCQKGQPSNKKAQLDKHLVDTKV